MDAPSTDEAFSAFVAKLQMLALSCPDLERREDAVRALACMQLLIDARTATKH